MHTRINYWHTLLATLVLCSSSQLNAESLPIKDISDRLSKSEFLAYKNVADFIEQSPKVTITVNPSQQDITELGDNVTKTLTGSDCNRDGKMDDNATCNAVYYQLWLKYAR
jgi:hypothetical protein